MEFLIDKDNRYPGCNAWTYHIQMVGKQVVCQDLTFKNTIKIPLGLSILMIRGFVYSNNKNASHANTYLSRLDCIHSPDECL